MNEGDRLDQLVDQELVYRTLDGQKEAFEILLERYMGRLVSYALKHTSDLNVAEDVAQEAFMRAYQSLQTCKNPERFWYWLVGIAQNCIRDGIYQRQRISAVNTEALSDIPAKSALGTERQDERSEALDKAIQALPPELRSILMMKYYGGMTCSEIARTLDKPLNTVTKLLSRAYEQLKIWMLPYFRRGQQ